MGMTVHSFASPRSQHATLHTLRDTHPSFRVIHWRAEEPTDPVPSVNGELGKLGKVGEGGGQGMNGPTLPAKVALDL